MANNKLLERRMSCRIRVPNPIEGVYREYQPENDKVYDAIMCISTEKHPAFCIIQIKDKTIVVRKDEYEVVEYV